jgi:hypothetical protein
VEISPAAATKLVNYVADKLEAAAGSQQPDISSQRQVDSESVRAEIKELFKRFHEDDILFKHDLGRALESAQNILSSLQRYWDVLNPFDRFGAIVRLLNELNLFIFNNYIQH